MLNDVRRSQEQDYLSGGCLSIILSRMLNACHFCLENNHRSKFHNLAKWRHCLRKIHPVSETGWIFLRPFIFPWLIFCLNTVMVLGHTDGDSGMKKKNEAMMGTFTGTALTFDFLPVCFIVQRTRAGPFGPCLVSEDLWTVLQSTDTHHYSQWQVGVCDSSYVNKCPLWFTSAFIFTWTSTTSPVDNTRVKCFSKIKYCFRLWVPHPSAAKDGKRIIHHQEA